MEELHRLSSHSDVFLRSACHKWQCAWGWRGDGGGGNFFLMSTLSPFCKCGSFTYNCSWWHQTSFHRRLKGILKSCSSCLRLSSISMSNQGPWEKIWSRKEIKKKKIYLTSTTSTTQALSICPVTCAPACNSHVCWEREYIINICPHFFFF